MRTSGKKGWLWFRAGLMVFVLCWGQFAYCWIPPGATNGTVDLVGSWENEYVSVHSQAHMYILERSAEILANDQYTNWSDVTLQLMQSLANGAWRADNDGSPTTVNFDFCVLFYCSEWNWPVGNSSSYNHFHNKDWQSHQEGLDLTGYNDAVAAAEVSTSLVGLIFGGLLTSSAEVDPPFKDHYMSAADLAQEKYNAAVSAWNRGQHAQAFYNLGWACHLLSDLAVNEHTFNSFVTHDNYENAANGNGRDPLFNAITARPTANYPDDVYQMARTMSVRELAVSLSSIVHTRQQWTWTEGASATFPPNAVSELLRFASPVPDNEKDYGDALKVALPNAERYTAALLAKFMDEVQIPMGAPPIVGTVTEVREDPSGIEQGLNQWGSIPGAFIFYAEANSGQWQYTQADVNGRFTLNLVPRHQYIVHPAAPGYRFQGEGVFVYYPEGGAPDAHFYKVGMQIEQRGGLAANQLSLYLRRLADSEYMSASPYPAPPIGGIGSTLKLPTPAMPKLPPLKQQALQVQTPTAANSGAAIRPDVLKKLMDTPGILPKDPKSLLMTTPSGALMLKPAYRPATLRQRMQLNRLPATATPMTVVKAGTMLPASKLALRRNLADNINTTLLEIKEVRHGVQFSSAAGAPLYDKPLVGKPLDELHLRPFDPVSPLAGSSWDLNLTYQNATYVQLQVSRLVSLSLGKVCANANEILGTVDRTQARRLGASTGTSAGGPQEQATTETALRLISARAPKATVTGPNGKPLQIFPLDDRGTLIDSLVYNGLAPIPAGEGVKLTVEVVDAPGYIRGANSPVTLNTNAMGRAALVLFPGTLPGKVRLLIKVVSDNQASYLPQTTLEFTVLPKQGTDNPVWGLTAPARHLRPYMLPFTADVTYSAPPASPWDNFRPKTLNPKWQPRTPGVVQPGEIRQLESHVRTN